MTFSSLRTKLILILLVLLSLLATATGLATLSAMKRDSELQAGHILSVASKVLREALNNRAGQLSSSVQILATDFGFRRAVATAEQETIKSVLANHGSRINASLTLLLSPDGALLASSDTAIKAADIAPLFQQTQGNSTAPVNDILHLAGQPYQLVLAPVRAPALIAWVGMGFPLDSTLAKQIRGITDLDISFVAEQAQGYQLYTSTLDAAYQQQLPAFQPDIAQAVALLRQSVARSGGFRTQVMGKCAGSVCWSAFYGRAREEFRRHVLQPPVP